MKNSKKEGILLIVFNQVLHTMANLKGIFSNGGLRFIFPSNLNGNEC